MAEQGPEPLRRAAGREAELPPMEGKAAAVKSIEENNTAASPIPEQRLLLLPGQKPGGREPVSVLMAGPGPMCIEPLRREPHPGETES